MGREARQGSEAGRGCESLQSTLVAIGAERSSGSLRGTSCLRRKQNTKAQIPVKAGTAWEVRSVVMDTILRNSLPLGGVARRVSLEGNPRGMAAQVAVGKVMVGAKAWLAAKILSGGRAGLEEHSGSLPPSGTCKTATTLSPRRGGLFFERAWCGRSLGRR